jgi:serine/threonine-protein kinase
MTTAQDVELTGTLVSRYTIVGLIGSGGMGHVYLGRDEHLLRYVAIKVLAGASSQADASQPLLREARMLSRFGNPYIAGIFDLITCGSRDYIVMEFVPGPTLKEVVASGPLPTGEVVRLGIQLARGLAAAHAASVIHRDLKPQNIKVTPWGQIKILDFGVASTSGAPVGLGGAEARTDRYPAGTVPYMSPEQIRGDHLDERTDIFSAGAVIYEMAAGVPAFPQRNLAQLIEAIQFHEPPRLSSLNPFVPEALERVVVKALRKDRDERHRAAVELAAELRAIRLPHRAYRNRHAGVEALPRPESPKPSAGASTSGHVLAD